MPKELPPKPLSLNSVIKPLQQKVAALERVVLELADFTTGGGSGYYDTPGAGLTGTGTTLNVGAGTGITVNADDVAIGDAELLAIAGLTSAANKLPYFTGSGAASLADFSAFGRSLVDDADATAGRATLAAAGTGVANSFTAAQTITIANNAALTALSGSSGAWTGINIGRATADYFMGPAAVIGHHVANSAVGDMVLRLNDSTKTMRFGVNIGTGNSIVNITSGGLDTAGTFTAFAGATYFTTLGTAFSLPTFNMGAGGAGLNTGDMQIFHAFDQFLLPSGKHLGLGRATSNVVADTSATGIGDKIALYNSSLAARYAIGVQTNTMVFAVPPGQGIGFRASPSAAGSATTGTENIRYTIGGTTGDSAINVLSQATARNAWIGVGRTATDGYIGVTGSTAPTTFFSDASAGDLTIQGLAGTMRLGVGSLGAASQLRLTSTGLTSTVSMAMGGNKVTGLASATANGEAVRFEQLFAGSFNLVTDSSFEGNAASITANWTPTGGTFVGSTDVAPRYGQRVGKLTSTGASQSYVGSAMILNIRPSQLYTFSAWARGDASTTNVFYVQVNFYNSSSTLVGSFNSAGTALTTSWQRQYASGTSPATADRAQVFILVNTASAVGKVIYVDGAQLEEGDTATAYIPKPDEILPETVGTGELATGSVTAVKIGANQVLASKLEASLVLSTTIVAGTPGAARVDLDNTGINAYNSSNQNLFRVSATTGLATFKTALSGARVEIDSSGLIGYNSGGTAVTSISSATGLGTITGGLIQTSSSATTGIKLTSTNFDAYDGTNSLFNINASTGIATFKTAASGARVELGSTGLKGYNSSGTLVTHIDSSTGVGSITGGIFQTSVADPKVRFDATDGFYTTDASANKLLQITAAGAVNIAVTTGATTSRSITYASGGVIVAGSEAYDFGPGVTFYKNFANPKVSGGGAVNSLEARDETGAVKASLKITYDDTTGASEVRVVAGTEDYYIAKSDARRDFVLANNHDGLLTTTFIDSSVYGAISALDGTGTNGSAATLARSDHKHAVQPDYIIRSSITSQNITTGGGATGSGNQIAFGTAIQSRNITVDAGNDDFTVPKAGLYLVQVYVTWDSNTLGNHRRLGISQNATGGTSSNVWFDYRAVAAGDSRQTISGMLVCNANDTIQIFAGQDSGATRTITDRRISIFRVGDV